MLNRTHNPSEALPWRHSLNLCLVSSIFFWMSCHKSSLWLAGRSVTTYECHTCKSKHKAAEHTCSAPCGSTSAMFSPVSSCVLPSWAANVSLWWISAKCESGVLSLRPWPRPSSRPTCPLDKTNQANTLIVPRSQSTCSWRDYGAIFSRVTSPTDFRARLSVSYPQCTTADITGSV